MQNFDNFRFEEDRPARLPAAPRARPFDLTTTVESRYLPLSASLEGQSRGPTDHSELAAGELPSLQAALDYHHPSISDETLVNLEDASLLQSSLEAKQRMPAHAPLSALSRRVEEPLRSGKLNKRSLELLELHSEQFSLAQKLRNAQPPVIAQAAKHQKAQENKPKAPGKMKSARNAPPAPVYFFQPSRERSEGSLIEQSKEAQATHHGRARARSEEMDSLMIKGFEHILLESDAESEDSPRTRHKPKQPRLHESPIREDPLQLRNTISRIESDEGFLFKMHQLSEPGEEASAAAAQASRPKTPDNTPLTDSLTSPIVTKQKSEAQRQNKIRGFFNQKSRSSSMSKIPFDNDSSDHHPIPKQAAAVPPAPPPPAQEQLKLPPSEPLGSDAHSNISSSLIALQHQKEKILLKPTQFNVLVAGESGVGKTTFIEQFMRVSKLAGQLQKFSQTPFVIHEGETLKDNSTVKVNRAPTILFTEYTRSRQQANIKLNLSLIDSPGYGKDADLRKWMKNLKLEITQRMDTFKLYKHENQRELFLKQHNSLPDPRVHLCLYFVNGHHIKPSDLLFMKELASLVNVLPVVAKADSFTTQELVEVKMQLLEDAQRRNVRFFDCLAAINVRNLGNLLGAGERPARCSAEQSARPVSAVQCDWSH